MDYPAKPDLAELVAGAFAWWEDAGIDSDFHDVAQNWLASPEPAETDDAAALPANAITEPPPPAFDRSVWPDSLDAFRTWWIDADLPGGLPDGRRVAPRGAAGAKLMVLVPDPEADDADQLLSGERGRLLSAIFAAMGIAEDETYVASVVPRHLPHAGWPALLAAGYAELALHHIALAEPRRLMVMGTSILSLVGHDPAHCPAAAQDYRVGGRSVPLIVTHDLGSLLKRPAWKAALWSCWLETTASAATPHTD